MWRTGSWVVPRLSGRPFLEQPPLYYWSQAGLFALLQRSDAGIARLPSALFSLGNLAMCIALGMRFFSRRACFLAGLVLLTLYTFMQRSHWIVVDSALAFGITGALACFAHGEASLGARRRWCWAGMTACLTVAFLSKGTIGPGLAAVGIFTYLIWRRSAREIVPLAVSGAFVGLVAALWLWGVWREVGSAGVLEFLAQNQLSRFFPHAMGSLGYEVGHIRPLYYYVIQGPTQFLPWSPLAALALWDAWRHRGELSERERAGLQLLISFLATSFTVLSLAGTKRALYLLPLASPLALLVGWWMQARLVRPRWQALLEESWGRAVLAVAVLLPAGLVWVDAGALRWLGVCAVLAALAWRLETDSAAERELRWERRLLLTAVSLSCFLIGGLPAIDRTKSFAPAIHSLDAALGPTAKLCALRPSETLRGLISFYTDRELCVIDDPTQLGPIAQVSPDLWLIAEHELPDLSGQRYATVRSDDWVFRLIRIAPPATTERANLAQSR